MGLINNENLYPKDTRITINDEVIGSDKDNNGVTRNYPMSSIVSLINEINELKFSLYKYSSVDANSKKGVFNIYGDFFKFSNIDQEYNDNSNIFNVFKDNKESILFYLKDGSESFAYYTIKNATQNSESFTFELELVGSLRTGIYILENKYLFNFNVISDSQTQIQSDWNQSAANEKDFIKNKPDLSDLMHLNVDEDIDSQKTWNLPNSTRGDNAIRVIQGGTGIAISVDVKTAAVGSQYQVRVKGTGIAVLNHANGTGVKLQNHANGTGLNMTNDSAGTAQEILQKPSSTGNSILTRKEVTDGVYEDRFKVDNAGNTTTQKLTIQDVTEDLTVTKSLFIDDKGEVKTRSSDLMHLNVDEDIKSRKTFNKTDANKEYKLSLNNTSTLNNNGVLEVSNSGNIGVLIQNTGAGAGVDGLNTSSGTFSVINQAHSSTGDSFVVKKNFTGISSEDVFKIDNAGNTTTQKLNVQDVLNLKPSTVPLSPIKGDLYFDSADNILKCCNGSVWKNLFS